VRLITRGGTNRADRYPWIVETVLKNRHQQFVNDGEAVVLDGDGIADFNALQSRRHDDKVWLYAFDILTLDGEDLRGLPLSIRKSNLARLLARRRPDGIFAAPRAKSAPTCSRRRATWALRAWCRSVRIGPIGPDGQRTGSRTGSIRRTGGWRIIGATGIGLDHLGDGGTVLRTLALVTRVVGAMALHLAEKV
jgi:hypothetical protein